MAFQSRRNSFLEAGNEVGMSERATMYTLAQFLSDGYIKKTSRGNYEKLQ